MGFFSRVREAFFSSSEERFDEERSEKQPPEKAPVEELVTVQEESRRKVDSVELKDVFLYLKSRPLLEFSYRDFEQKENESREDYDQRLTEYELNLRREYAQFVDAFPESLKDLLPPFEQLKDFPFPDSAHPEKVGALPNEKQKENSYSNLITGLHDQLPAFELPGMGLSEEAGTLDDLIIGRLQSFVVSAELFSEIHRGVDYQEDTNIFNK